MDTKDLLQINDFGEGMNTDTSDALMSKSSYRLANNVRYITNTSENSGELHMIEGAAGEFRFDGESIIECTNLRDLEIYVTQTDDKKYWKVRTRKGDDFYTAAKIPAEKNRVIDKKLSLVTRYEDEDNQKLYIADGVGPVLCIQLCPKEVNGTRVMRHTILNDVVSYPSMKLSKPIFCGLIDGNIKPCVVGYSYQLYERYGHLSEISPSTKLISLYKGASIANDAKRITGYLSDEPTSKGVHIKINVGDYTGFNRIKIYRISYSEVGQLPQIDCILDSAISSSIIDVLDTGLESLQVLTLEEYNAITGIHIVPKTIESKDDYMFAANIKNDENSYYCPEFNPLEAITYSFTTVDIIADQNVIENDGFIKRPKLGDGNSNALTTSIGSFVSEYVDVNPTDVLSYENSKVSYLFKSLRRGEKYKFGIVLYNKDCLASPVYFYKDIDINTDIPIFELSEDNDLIVHPIGISFNINESKLPSDCVYYEIVRCGKSINDVQIVALGVLSRPICKSYDYNSEKMEYPLTPSGFITTYNTRFTIGDFLTDPAISIHNNEDAANSIQSTNFNPGGLQLLSGEPVEFQLNLNIFLFISPEYSYLEDTIKDSLKGCELEIKPLLFLTPLKTELITSELYYNRFNFGNSYTNVTVDDKGININCPLGVYFSYYFPLMPRDLNLSGYAHDCEMFTENANRYQYCKLYTQDSIDTIKKYEITSINFPETLRWDDFATTTGEDYQCKYVDKVVPIGGKNFVNWVCGHTYNTNWQYPEYPDGNDGYDNPDDLGNVSHSVLGPGGKCMLIKVDTEDLATNENNHPNQYIGTYLCNLIKKQSSTNNSTEEQNKQAIYRSFGDLFEKQGGTQTHVVFNGDCFVNVFEYIAQHKFAHPTSKFYRTSLNVYAIPMETSVNLAYTSGYEFSKEINNSSGNITYIQNYVSNVNGIFSLDKPLYSYNSVYSATDTSRTLISKEKFEDSNDLQNTDYRVYHSLLKTNNESVDNWLKYQPANFLDVDTRNGAITGLRKFKNYLVFWLECATGLLSVNERSMISDDSNLPLILGSGGVLTRFDYLTNQNGMYLDDYSDVQSNTTLYWWDRVNKTICGFASGKDIVELSKLKFIQNYLNKNDAINNPTLVYDDKFNEILFNVVDGEGHEDGSIVYNENISKFTSIYNIRPEHKIELPERVLLTRGTNVYQWDKLFDGEHVKGLKNDILTPYLKYIVNALSVYTKVFDNGEFAGRVYGGDDLSYLTLKFSTPLKQYSILPGSDILNREYNFTYIIPRNLEDGEQPLYGGRLRGKTMQCELESSNNSYDFSLQFIKNKFRASWS